MERVTHKIKHNPVEAHRHTVQAIERDELGRFWLTFRWAHQDCQWERVAELLPAQVELWVKNGVAVEAYKYTLT